MTTLVRRITFAALTLASGVAVGAPEAADIRDIRGPVVAPVEPAWWLYLAIAACALATAVVVRWLSRRTRVALSPDAIALRELGAATSQLDAGDAHAFSVAVSTTVRDYVERAFSVRAPTLTTDELLQGLMNEDSPVTAHRGELGSFLEYCDLAKYARWSLTREQMTGMLDSARTFIRATAHPPRVAGPVEVTQGATS